MLIPPSISYFGNKQRASVLKGEALVFTKFIQNIAELGGVNHVFRTKVLSDGSIINVSSRKDIYNNRTANIEIIGAPLPAPNPSEVQFELYALDLFPFWQNVPAGIIGRLFLVKEFSDIFRNSSLYYFKINGTYYNHFTESSGQKKWKRDPDNPHAIITINNKDIGYAKDPDNKEIKGHFSARINTPSNEGLISTVEVYKNGERKEGVLINGTKKGKMIFKVLGDTFTAIPFMSITYDFLRFFDVYDKSPRKDRIKLTKE